MIHTLYLLATLFLLTYGKRTNYEIRNEKLKALVKLGDKQWIAVNKLIKTTGANPKTMYNKDITVLHYAAKHGYLNLVRTLDNEGASFFTTSKLEQKTSLHFAAAHGHIKVVEYIVSDEELEFGTCQTLNKQDIHNNTPLSLAIDNEFPDVVFQLLGAGALMENESNERREKFIVLMENSFILAVKNNNVNRVGLLLKVGVPASTMDPDSSLTVLQWAQNKNYIHVVRLLEKYDLEKPVVLVKKVKSKSNSKSANGATKIYHITNNDLVMYNAKQTKQIFYYGPLLIITVALCTLNLILWGYLDLEDIKLTLTILVAFSICALFVMCVTFGQDVDGDGDFDRNDLVALADTDSSGSVSMYELLTSPLFLCIAVILVLSMWLILEKKNVADLKVKYLGLENQMNLLNVSLDKREKLHDQQIQLMENNLDSNKKVVENLIKSSDLMQKSADKSSKQYYQLKNEKDVELFHNQRLVVNAEYRLRTARIQRASSKKARDKFEKQVNNLKGDKIKLQNEILHLKQKNKDLKKEITKFKNYCKKKDAALDNLRSKVKQSNKDWSTKLQKVIKANQIKLKRQLQEAQQSQDTERTAWNDAWKEAEEEHVRTITEMQENRRRGETVWVDAWKEAESEHGKIVQAMQDKIHSGDKAWVDAWKEAESEHGKIVQAMQDKIRSSDKAWETAAKEQAKALLEEFNVLRKKLEQENLEQNNLLVKDFDTKLKAAQEQRTNEAKTWEKAAKEQAKVLQKKISELEKKVTFGKSKMNQLSQLVKVLVKDQILENEQFKEKLEEDMESSSMHSQAIKMWNNLTGMESVAMQSMQNLSLFNARLVNIKMYVDSVEADNTILILMNGEQETMDDQVKILETKTKEASSKGLNVDAGGWVPNETKKIN